jgi:hypothetical protein
VATWHDTWPHLLRAWPQRIERSYQRDYVREDEARNIAARKETEVVQQAIASGISSLRQALSEELDKLEGRLDSGPFGR